MSRRLKGTVYFEIEGVAFPAQITRAVVGPDGLTFEAQGQADGSPYRLEARLTRHENSCSGPGQFLDHGHVTDSCQITLQSTYLNDPEWELTGQIIFIGVNGPENPLDLSLDLRFID